MRVNPWGSSARVGVRGLVAIEVVVVEGAEEVEAKRGRLAGADATEPSFKGTSSLTTMVMLVSLLDGRSTGLLEGFSIASSLAERFLDEANNLRRNYKSTKTQ